MTIKEYKARVARNEYLEALGAAVVAAYWIDRGKEEL